jgi:hypothetical protein
MKKYIAALSLTVATFASYASVIADYRDAAAFPAKQNDLGLFTISGNGYGNHNDPVNLLYTFEPNTLYVGFNFTASHFETLSVHVTAADGTSDDFSRGITGDPMFWGFSDADSHISTVQFSVTSASSSNGKDNISNDKIMIGSVIGYVQPTSPAEVPEPATVALFGLGLLGFAASRRRSVKRKHA